MLVVISSDHVQIYNTMLAKKLLYLHIQNKVNPSDLLLKVINNKFLINLDYNKLLIWK